MQPKYKVDFPGGVAVEPLPVAAGQRVTVLYNGVLSQNGADNVFIHCGYGDANAWENVRDLKMRRTSWGWEKSFEPDAQEKLNFCFRDGADNWDNNNQYNWSFDIDSNIWSEMQ